MVDGTGRYVVRMLIVEGRLNICRLFLGNYVGFVVEFVILTSSDNIFGILLLYCQNRGIGILLTSFSPLRILCLYLLIGTSILKILCSILSIIRTSHIREFLLQNF